MQSNLPNLIVGGLHKSGTSSLYSYLSQHPEICASAKKEPYYFWPFVYDKPLVSIDEYRALFSSCKDEKYRFEATARYFYGGRRVAEGIKKILGAETKIIFLFREQLDHLLSIFKYKKYNLVIPKETSLNSYIKDSLINGSKEIFDSEVGAYNILEHGKYHHYLKQWYEVFDHRNIKVTFFEDLKNDPTGYLQDLALWLHIDRASFEEINLAPDNRSTNIKNPQLHKYARKIFHGMEEFWRDHPKLKNTLRDLYHKLNGSRHTDSLDKESIEILKPYYAKENEKFIELLKEHGYNKFPNWLRSYELQHHK